MGNKKKNVSNTNISTVKYLNHKCAFFLSNATFGVIQKINAIMSKKYCIGIKKSSLAYIIYLTSGHANASIVTYLVISSSV